MPLFILPVIMSVMLTFIIFSPLMILCAENGIPW